MERGGAMATDDAKKHRPKALSVDQDGWSMPLDEAIAALPEIPTCRICKLEPVDRGALGVQTMCRACYLTERATRMNRQSGQKADHCPRKRAAGFDSYAEFGSSYKWLRMSILTKRKRDE